jgi:hypothetical protein
MQQARGSWVSGFATAGPRGSEVSGCGPPTTPWKHEGCCSALLGPAWWRAVELLRARVRGSGVRGSGMRGAVNRRIPEGCWAVSLAALGAGWCMAHGGQCGAGPPSPCRTRSSPSAQTWAGRRTLRSTMSRCMAAAGAAGGAGTWSQRVRCHQHCCDQTHASVMAAGQAHWPGQLWQRVPGHRPAHGQGGRHQGHAKAAG